MSIFDVFTMLGGLAMFLYGMNVLGAALEKRAGSRFKDILRSMTANPIKGFLLGLVVTAVIQSSSSTTVMVVGFVNSGLMTLHQSIGVIMGANLGAAVTSWLLSLTGIQGESFWIQMLKPTSWTPILGLIGIIFYMFQKNPKRKDTGLILLGFSVMMFGMDVMSNAVSGLQDVPEFTRVLSLFSNPVLGVLAGTIVTAIIQSSAASVGILQALSATGSIPYAIVIPVVMGQNIGTCISAMLSSIGASKNARRAALVHLYFNILATLILLPLFCLLNAVLHFSFVAESATPLGIAIVHTVFKLCALAVMTPCTRLLEKLAMLSVPDSEADRRKASLLDERLLATPSVAVERSHEVTIEMANEAAESLSIAFSQLASYDKTAAARVRELENTVDEYEDQLGSYLVRLSSYAMSEQDRFEANRLLHMIGDFERISDHAVNILESAEEVHEKKLVFSPEAHQELNTMFQAVAEITQLAVEAFREGNMDKAVMVEPLEQVVDDLRDTLKRRHIDRLQCGECTIELGFVLTDLLTNLERISDHCSNIAGCLLEMEAHEDLDIHAYLRKVRDSDGSEYTNYYDYFRNKYSIA